jgi:ABC-type antimicrobial peptide transport system permease subunit
MITMFFIVYIAIGILILNAMLMAVFERIREFGVLKALGVGPFDVLRLIAVESAIQTGLALLVGVSFATPGILYLSRTGLDLGRFGDFSVMGIAMDPVWRAAVTTGVFTGPIVTLVLIVSAAVIYPAVKAAVIDPVDAMHHH